MIKDNEITGVARDEERSAPAVSGGDLPPDAERKARLPQKPVQGCCRIL